MEIINLNPRKRVQCESEFNYYALCYREGETSNNSILREVALRRIKGLLDEIYFMDIPATDFNFPDYAFYVVQLNKMGHKLKTKARPPSY